MIKEVTVHMTLEWTFDKRDWSAEKKQMEELEANPKLVLGYDTINSIFMLNDLDYPTAKEIKVTYYDK
jgi:hypothetical protein